ncbi:MAG: cellulase family glycosylhydrolase [Armatimonadota bacterium]|nr:glycoside hydrolase family 5 protein [bacterium]
MKLVRLAVLAAFVLALCGTAFAEGFVKADGPRLMLDGKEYRAIGVNIPILHAAYNGTFHHTQHDYGTPAKAKQAMIDAIIDAEKSHVAFVRFFASPGYPSDIDMFYAKDKDKYWQQMDEVISLCRRHHLKLIPSLNMTRTWQPYYNEVGQAILDPNSKTYKASYEYIREFVTRYKDDPIILMWEIANESMLGADVDCQGADFLPSECYTPGKQFREKQVREDSFTWDMVLRIYKEQTAFIKSIDKNHLVTSGDASVRAECTSRRETFPNYKFRTDTLREWIANNLASQPEPLDVFSYHMYGSLADKKSWEGAFNIPPLDFDRSLIRATHAARVPVFIGEFGQYNPAPTSESAASFTCKFIDMLETEHVSLAAFWAWHFPWQPENDVTSSTNPPLAKRIAAFNKKYAGMK